jgi:hypothetical protein
MIDIRAINPSGVLSGEHPENLARLGTLGVVIAGLMALLVLVL